MTNSYLGIITSSGLESLVAETEHAAPFLLRRVARHPCREAIAFWAVLDDRTARSVIREIAAGRFQEALYQISKRALHHGTLLPPWKEDDLIHLA